MYQCQLSEWDSCYEFRLFILFSLGKKVHERQIKHSCPFLRRWPVNLIKTAEGKTQICLWFQLADFNLTTTSSNMPVSILTWAKKCQEHENFCQNNRNTTFNIIIHNRLQHVLHSSAVSLKRKNVCTSVFIFRPSDLNLCRATFYCRYSCQS